MGRRPNICFRALSRSSDAVATRRWAHSDRLGSRYGRHPENYNRDSVPFEKRVPYSLGHTVRNNSMLFESDLCLERGNVVSK